MKSKKRKKKKEEEEMIKIQDHIQFSLIIAKGFHLEGLKDRNI